MPRIFLQYLQYFLTVLLQRCTVNCSSRHCDAPKTGLTCVQVCMHVSGTVASVYVLHCTALLSRYAQRTCRACKCASMCVSETMWVSASAALLSRYAQLPLLSLQRTENERNRKGMRGSNLRHYNNNSCLQYWPFTVRGRLPFCEFNIFFLPSFCALLPLLAFCFHWGFSRSFALAQQCYQLSCLISI